MKKNLFSYFVYFLLHLSALLAYSMALQEQVKSDIFESSIDEGMLEWFRQRFTIPIEYSLHTTDKKA